MTTSLVRTAPSHEELRKTQRSQYGSTVTRSDTVQGVPLASTCSPHQEVGIPVVGPNVSHDRQPDHHAAYLGQHVVQPTRSTSVHSQGVILQGFDDFRIT